MKRIDVRAAVRSKYQGWVPECALRRLERLVHEDELNKMMELQEEVDGVSMGHRIMDYLGISCEIIGSERLPAPHERTLFVSNHPLGGVDGIIYCAMLGDIYDGRLKIPVNDVLMSVYQFGDIFLPVNKYGKQARSSIRQINEALASEDQVLTFASGMVSRTNNKGEVYDLDWQPSFIRMAKQSNRSVTPLFFEGENSPRFYKWARRRIKAGLKFPLELILLPDEMFRSKGKHFKIIVGEPMASEELPLDHGAEYANKLRDSLYDFPERYR